jgi:hypothetical protein
MSRLAVLIVTAAVLALAACASGHSGKASSSAPVPAETITPVSPSSNPPSGLNAGCQVGIDSGGFQPVTAQNIGNGTSAYQVTVTNNTSSPVTVDGFSVAFSAFGSQVTTDSATVNTSLMEPGENWDFTIDVTNGIQVSQNTYLNETCQVNQVDTANGPVAPNMVSEPNGEQNTHVQDVQQAQQALANDVSRLTRDSASWPRC